MGRVIHLVASGEPAWAGAVLRVPRRCMGRLRGFGSTGAAHIFCRLLTPLWSFQHADLVNRVPAAQRTQAASVLPANAFGEANRADRKCDRALRLHKSYPGRKR